MPKSKKEKSNSIQKKINEAANILECAGLPIQKLSQRKKDRACMALLAVADLKPNSKWENAKIWGINESIFALSTREIIKYWNDNFEENIADSSYDDIRRQDLKLLVLTGIVSNSVVNPNASTNDPSRRYAISPIAENLIKSYGLNNWSQIAKSFIKEHGNITHRLQHTREIKLVPVNLPDGIKLELSAGIHNEIQKAIVEEFIPRFAPNSEILYIGDTTDKYLYLKNESLAKLGIAEPEHDMLPDVLAFNHEKNWLFLIEAVHSSNPITQTRYIELEDFFKNAKKDCVFVSAFATRNDFRKFISDLAWETEVWIADEPDHMIHFNGEKFIGPYKK